MIDYQEVLKDIDSFFNFLLREFPEALQYEEKWKKYYMSIIRESSKIALVSERDLYFIARKHFTDSVLISRHIDKQSITDIGSGAGFPGIPVAILNPEKSIFLIERNVKKTVFLKSVKIALGLKNVHVVREDLSRMDDIPGEAFVSRAADHEKILKILKEKNLKNRKFYAVIPFKKDIKESFIKILNPLTDEKFKLLEIELL